MQDVLSEEERHHWMELVVLVVNAFFPNVEYGTWPLCAIPPPPCPCLCEMDIGLEEEET